MAEQNRGIHISPSFLIAGSLLLSVLFSNKQAFFGVHLPGEVALRINNQLSGIFFILAAWLFFSRRKPMESLLTGLLIAITVALLSVGTNYATLGVGPGQSIQDDGFNLTGGFLMLASGALATYLWLRRRPSTQPKSVKANVRSRK